jgi:group I intron endonuclease
MKKIIYCIENIKNGFKYIGQSNTPKKRIATHFSTLKNNKHCNRKLQKSFNEYGYDNFITYYLTDYIENYDEVEQSFIIEYMHKDKCFNKYIVANSPKILKGENHPRATISLKKCEEIRSLLKCINVKISDIIKNLKVTADVVGKINIGDSWFSELEMYPIRGSYMKMCVIDMLKNTAYTQKEISKMLELSRSCVTMINIGKNHHDKNIIYPIRK